VEPVISVPSQPDRDTARAGFCLAKAPNWDITGFKCELPAGHSGPHGAYIWQEWGDD